MKWFSAILANRIYNNHFNGWYKPVEFLREFKSVTAAELYDTTSSSGDWSGYIVQKIGKRSYLIPFSQENQAFRGGGYSLYTGNPLASWEGELTEDDIYDILNDFGY